MMSLQFDKVGNTTGKVALLDALSMTGVEAWDADNYEKRAEVSIRVGDFYTTYFYINDALDETETDIIDGDVWADGSDVVLTSDDDLEIGTGFWFKAPVCDPDASVTFAGQVLEADSAPITVPQNQYAIRANPFPTAIALNSDKFVVSGIDAYDADNYEKRTEISVRRGEFYTTYFYINDALDETETDIIDGDVWADGSDVIVTGTQINPGESFWVKSPVTAGSFTITK